MKIPSLDGLRAVSILLVVVGHVANGAHWSQNTARTLLGNAALGVNVFFVISGFLITTLLLREFSAMATINLKQFYFRRAFRILPPYYFYLAAIVLLNAANIFPLPANALTSATFFLWDYWPIAGAWYFDHLWSLAVEEQFYMIWPVLLAVALHRRKRRLSAVIALAVISLSPLIRLGTYCFAPESLRTHLYFMFHSRADSLMFGAFCALAIDSYYFEKVYQAMVRYVWVAALFVLVVSPLLARAFGGVYLYVVGYTLEGAAIALVMIWLIRNPDSTAGRILNSRPAVQFGVMSYSIYLWQTLFLDASNQSFLGTPPISILMIAAFASLSYFGVERPTLRLRALLARRRSLKLQIE